MDAARTTVVGIYIDVSGKLGPEGAAVVIVELLGDGKTLVVTDANRSGNMKVILNHITMPELAWIMDAISNHRKIA